VNSVKSRYSKRRREISKNGASLPTKRPIEKSASVPQRTVDDLAAAA